MQSSQPSKLEDIYKGIAIALLATFFIGIRVMNWQHKAENRRLEANSLTSPEMTQNVELTIRGKAYHDEKQFKAIRNDMTFRQVLKTLHIMRTQEKVGHYFVRENVMTRFMNPDNSSIEVDFQYGYVIGKRLVSRERNLAREQAGNTPEAPQEE